MYVLLRAFQAGLFDATVPVKGHSTKTGVYVQPHQAKRKKRLDDPSADLFAEPAKPVPEPAKEPEPVKPAPAPEPAPEKKKSPDPEHDTLWRAGDLTDAHHQGIFFTTKQEVAAQYSTIHPGEPRPVHAYRLRPGANIKIAAGRFSLVSKLDPTWDKDKILNKFINRQFKGGNKLPYQGITAEGWLQIEAEKRIKALLEKQGIDGIYYVGQKETDQEGEYQIFNEKTVTRQERPPEPEPEPEPTPEAIIKANPAMAGSFSGYASSSHHDINGFLRYGVDNYMADHDYLPESHERDIQYAIDQMKKAFDLVPPRDLTGLWRGDKNQILSKLLRKAGIEIDELTDDNLARLKGMRFKDNGFVSTSKNPSVANAFKGVGQLVRTAGPNSIDSSLLRIEGKVPAITMNEVLHFPSSEDEVLLKNGLTFEVMDTYWEKSQDQYSLKTLILVLKVSE